jgi:hypothetical protein
LQHLFSQHLFAAIFCSAALVCAQHLFAARVRSTCA